MPAERLGWLALVGALALFFLLGVPLQMVSTGVGIWFTEVFLFFGFGWALTRWSGRAPGPYLGLSWPGVGPMLVALGVAVANYEDVADVEGEAEVGERYGVAQALPVAERVDEVTRLRLERDTYT